ncbi:4-amino-4-deoxychorismate lyase [Salibacterium salarium]|uniref:aminodeoxychorismate lyase n=1 Tax=Salibacterium salarium TaxID=284579 RepID=A0A3R9QMT4_9BACI|nr:aminodeoxychorismate lyase [Salibacterium salarium]RSL29322.1 4-amino-4-deoxychorismate lyase [Salibacterium salarium]
MYVYINGDIQEAGDARLSVFEHGFMYGLGLFETFRINEGHPFLLDDHFRRMEKGLQWMNIVWEYNRENVLSQLQMLLKANNWNNAYVRYNISAGEDKLGLSTEPYRSPTILIYMKPMPKLQGKQAAAKSGTVVTIPRNTPETAVRLKSHHYLNNVLGKRETGNDPETEGIFLTADGYLAEGVVSNVFWIKGSVLYTPSLETGILDGVTRAFVIQLAKKHGMYVREGRFYPAHLYEADEVFVTNSIQEIVRLTAVDDYSWSDKKETSAIDLFQQEYAEYRRALWRAEEIFQ